MIRRMWLVPAIVAGWLVAGLAAQAPTDFSGRWTVEPAPRG